jgi:hypothetical protein
MFNTPLLADIAEWIVPLVVVAVYIISHLWNLVKGSQQQAPQRRSQNERTLQPQPADQRGANPAAPQATGQGKLNAEIEQFLKRANERRGEKPGRQKQARQQSPPKAPLPSEKKARAPEPVAAQRRGFDSIAESVQQHLGSRTFDQREQRLADDVVRAEQELSQHVEQAFTHRLGTLGSGETAVTPIDAAVAPTSDSTSMARAVAGLLVNQQSLRQAVLLKEILERPTDRW